VSDPENKRPCSIFTKFSAFVKVSWSVNYYNFGIHSRVSGVMGVLHLGAFSQIFIAP